MITIAENHSNVVKIISATSGEFGTMEPALKGTKRLANIRKQELRRAAKVEGIQSVEFLGYLDAHLELNKEVLQSFQIAIQNFKPDIIFAPECFYSYYPHKDHIRTGFAVYQIVQKMQETDRPKLYLYHSYVNTHFFPMLHWRRQSKALKQHVSQFYLLMPMYPIRFFLGFYFGFRLPRKSRFHFLAEAFRKVDFKADLNCKLSFKQRIYKIIVLKVKRLFNPKNLTK